MKTIMKATAIAAVVAFAAPAVSAQAASKHHHHHHAMKGGKTHQNVKETDQGTARLNEQSLQQARSGQVPAGSAPAAMGPAASGPASTSTMAPGTGTSAPMGGTAPANAPQ